MLYNAKYAVAHFSGGEMEYIRFGSGKKTLVMLPGLGESLRTLKGMALPMALMYRKFAGEYTVYVFSRKENLPDGVTTRDMARDQKLVMDALGIRQADVVGVSMGGMIAQHLAIDAPEKVGKLVLVVTSSRQNPVLIDAVSEWIDMARSGDHHALMESNLRRIYSESYYRRNKWMLPLLGKLTKPQSYDRFLTQADACLNHRSYDDLNRIQAPTLILGGEKDDTLGGDASREIAERIPNARLRMYPQWGHGLYEEAKDFIPTVVDFLREKN